ncbi:uncharacterized protein LOC142240319 [Haematobia irritans]|uniref:uncharacterized protein LOC142240319 n=1 Tax=Haematobia irritans TaxID=7368 RepID=UPI003F4FA223
MAHLKISLITIFLILVPYKTFVFGLSSFYWGHIKKNHDILHSDRVDITPKLTEPLQTVTVQFPGPGKTNPTPLAAILVHDYSSPGSYGHFYIRDGGPGYNYSTVEITPENFQPVKATITYIIDGLSHSF